MNRYTEDGIVTKPINVADLQQLLRRSHSNLGEVVSASAPTSVGGLCKHENINKWSKYKPVSTDRLFVDESELIEVMLDANYGLITSNMLFDAESLALGTAEDTNDYLYDHVRAPYQLSHFTKYNHAAVCPIRVVWQQKDTDYGQSLSAILYLDTQDIDGLSLIENYIESLGKVLEDYTFTIAIIQNEQVVAYKSAIDPLKDYYDEYNREIGCYLNEIEGMANGASTYAVAMLKGSNNAISLNADGGALSPTFVFNANAVSEALKGITPTLESFLFTRDTTYTEKGFAKWKIDEITFSLIIPNISQFMARYTNNKSANSLQIAKWKIQIRSVDGGNLYIPDEYGDRPDDDDYARGWQDLVEYTYIPNAEDGGLWEEGETLYNLFVYSSKFFGTSLYNSGYFYTDRDTSVSTSAKYGLRIMLRAGGDTDTYREVDYTSADILIPLNGDIAKKL